MMDEESVKPLWRTMAFDAAREKCVNVRDDGSPFLMVWNHLECRCYSTTQDNLHWSVPELYRFFTEKYSAVI